MKLFTVFAVLLAVVSSVDARSHHHRHARKSQPTPTVEADPTLYPLVINTWGGAFTAATDAAYELMQSQPSASALDIVEVGCATCEANQCDGTVGYGGSPDEACESTLDAMIMDGNTMNVGSVASLRRVRDAISVARFVLEYTTHTMLAGDLATQFAIQNGFTEENLSTNHSLELCQVWKQNNCQPNFRVNVSPDPTKSCGPYLPNKTMNADHSFFAEPPYTTHDTVSMLVIQRDMTMAAGTSTNGATNKIPGRVGDGPITGSGSYVDADVGGAGSTGDGDIMMRFLPSFMAVENLRRGMNATMAARDVLARIAKKFPKANAGIFVAAKDGTHGGAAIGFQTFQYSYRQGTDATVTKVVPIPPETEESLKQIWATWNW